MNCGLLGRHLSHSYSPQIHSLLGNYSYGLFEKEPEELEDFLKHGDFTGLNVTVPYKKQVLPFLDELTPVARRIGAVNTVVRRGPRLVGHNTDYFGFLTMVSASGLDLAGKKVLILGSGGASCTAQAVLEELGALSVVISRQGENNYGNLHLHADAAAIVNTTPVGMYPNVGVSPLKLDRFPQLEGVLDVIYNPARTQLLLEAEDRGLVTVNGLLMLVAQAKEAAQWFLDAPIPDAMIPAIHRKLRQQMQNIVLIGMPGSGKSTVGRLLADRLGKKFVDADAALEAQAGRSIPEIFAQDGEEGFRALETQILAQLGKESGLVIATGGGCVTRPENRPLLRQNGTLFWLTRDLSKLPTEGRPLSQAQKLEQMYLQRRPLYEAFADRTVSNDGELSRTVQSITDLWEEQE